MPLCPFWRHGRKLSFRAPHSNAYPSSNFTGVFFLRLATSGYQSRLFNLRNIRTIWGRMEWVHRSRHSPPRSRNGDRLSPALQKLSTPGSVHSSYLQTIHILFLSSPFCDNEMSEGVYCETGKPGLSVLLLATVQFAMCPQTEERQI